MTPPRVAAIIVHYGEPLPTQRLLASLARSTSPISEKIVVINDETDPAHFGDSRCELVGRNLGFGGGANRGARCARNHLPETGLDYLWILNNDLWVYPETLSRLLTPLGQDPKLAIVGPRIVERATGRIWHDGGRLNPARATIESLGFAEVPSRTVLPFAPDFVCGCAPLIRESAFAQVGGFDESWFLYYEDVDLSRRLAGAGWRLLHEPRAVVAHEGGGSVRNRPLRGRLDRLRSRLRYWREEGPPGATAALRRQLLKKAIARTVVGRIDEAVLYWRLYRDSASDNSKP